MKKESFMIFKFVKIAIIILSIFFFMFAIKNFYYHYKEEKLIVNYLKSHGVDIFKSNVTLSKSLALKISELVYKDFNTNSNTWKHFNLQNRPFLRNSVLELLKWKEGLCGEGARVVARLLQKIGFDATRVQLYTLKLGKIGHVVVSVRLNNKEFFVDTINSALWFHKIVEIADVGPECYPIIHYRQKDKKRRKDKIREECKMLVNYYPLYSYEAIPFSKLFNLVGFDVYVFNLGRPPEIISYLAESPYLIKGIFWIILSMLFFLTVKVIKRKK